MAEGKEEFPRPQFSRRPATALGGHFTGTVRWIPGEERNWNVYARGNWYTRLSTHYNDVRSLERVIFSRAPSTVFLDVPSVCLDIPRYASNFCYLFLFKSPSTLLLPIFVLPRSCSLWLHRDEPFVDGSTRNVWHEVLGITAKLVELRVFPVIICLPLCQCRGLFAFSRFLGIGESRELLKCDLIVAFFGRRYWLEGSVIGVIMLTLEISEIDVQQSLYRNFQDEKLWNRCEVYETSFWAVK